MDFKNHQIAWTHEKISRYWDYISKNPSLSHQYFGKLFGKHVASLINKEIGFKNTPRILDLSCGRGDLLNYCLKYFNSKHLFAGTDFSHENIEAINARFLQNKQFSGSELLTRYPSQMCDGIFDLIINTEVIEHLNDDDLDSMLTEMSRLLSSNGILFVTTRLDENLDLESIQCPDCGGVFHRWQHVRSWTAEKLEQKFNQYGFAKIIIKKDKFASSLKFRIAFAIAMKLKIIPPTALIYIGRKIS